MRIENCIISPYTVELVRYRYSQFEVLDLFSAVFGSITLVSMSLTFILSLLTSQCKPLTYLSVNKASIYRPAVYEVQLFLFSVSACRVFLLSKVVK